MTLAQGLVQTQTTCQFGCIPVALSVGYHSHDKASSTFFVGGDQMSFMETIKSLASFSALTDTIIHYWLDPFTDRGIAPSCLKCAL
jgi:hypothetical protein